MLSVDGIRSAAAAGRLEGLPETAHLLDRCADEITTLRARVEALEALLRYGRHEHRCIWNQGGSITSECDCGYLAARRKLDGEGE